MSGVETQTAGLRERLDVALGGAYTLERELGRGGMATVYLAHERKHGRRVAVETEADAKIEPVVALSALEVEGVPVDADEVRLPGGDDEVWAAEGNFDTGSVHARDEDRQAQTIGLLRAFVVRSAEVCGDHAAGIASVRLQWVDDRMHVEGLI